MTAVQGLAIVILLIAISWRLKDVNKTLTRIAEALEKKKGES